MEFHLFPLFAFLTVTLLVASHAAHLSPQAYWNTVLPTSPMPKAVKTLLPSEANSGFGRGGTFYFSMRKGGFNSDGIRIYTRAGQPDQVKHYLSTGQNLYFLEKDMKQGTVLKLDIAKDIKGVTFMPRDASESIPFSSQKMADILSRFSFQPNSKEAEIMKQTIHNCEETPLKGEQKFCATSLESMIDFSVSNLGKNVRALSTELSRETPLQKYSITEQPKKLEGQGNGEIVVCHMQSYAYAVFFCHNVHSTRAYALSLEGADGTKGKAVAVCHSDTAKWNPKHISFQLLKVKPGSGAICHILPEDNMLWVPLK